MERSAAIPILLWTQQPFVGRGLEAVFRGRTDYRLLPCCENLADCLRCLCVEPAEIVLVYLTSRSSLSDIQTLRAAAQGSQVVLWGEGLEGEFAIQAMQLGVRGVLSSCISIEGLLAALENIHRGMLCFEPELMESVLKQRRIALTKRQGQIVSLVSQGFKNKEIATVMGITEGTVKVYLYKLFRKLGVNDRLDMALYGLKNIFVGRASPDSFGPSSLPPKVRERSRLHIVN